MLMQSELKQSLPEGQFHLPFAGVRRLPPRKANHTNDLVDVVDDALDDDVRILVLGLLEELGQRCLALCLAVEWWRGPFRRDDVARQLQQLFEEFDTRKKPLLVALLECFEPLAQLLEARVVTALA